MATRNPNQMARDWSRAMLSPLEEQMIHDGVSWANAAEVLAHEPEAWVAVPLEGEATLEEVAKLLDHPLEVIKSLTWEYRFGRLRPAFPLSPREAIFYSEPVTPHFIQGHIRGTVTMASFWAYLGAWYLNSGDRGKDLQAYLEVRRNGWGEPGMYRLEFTPGIHQGEPFDAVQIPLR